MPRDGIEREFKTMLEGAGERERILALLGNPVRVLGQRNLLFDTARQALAAAALSLRLRHEGERWLLTAKAEPRERRTDPPSPFGAPRPDAQGVHAQGFHTQGFHARGLRVREPGAQDSSTQDFNARNLGARGFNARGEAEREVDAEAALRLVAGMADPIACLREAEPEGMALGLADAIEAVAGGDPLAVIGEFRNERTLCAATLPCGTEVSVALDRSEMPDGTIEHELELEIGHGAVAAAAAFLDELMRRARVPFRPAASKRQRFARALARRTAACV